MKYVSEPDPFTIRRHDNGEELLQIEPRTVARIAACLIALHAEVATQVHDVEGDPCGTFFPHEAAELLPALHRADHLDRLEEAAKNLQGTIREVALLLEHAQGIADLSDEAAAPAFALADRMLWDAVSRSPIRAATETLAAPVWEVVKRLNEAWEPVGASS